LNCKGLINELADYLDKALDPAMRAELEQHLGRCTKCRVIVDTTKKTIDIFCNAEPAPLPSEVRSRLHAALAKRLGRHGA
jgi:anti-sigma factor RsiW